MVGAPERSRRRITVVANELRGFHPVGGMGTAMTFLALALARLGHSVDVLVGVMHHGEPIDPYWGEVYARAAVRIRWAPLGQERVEPAQFVNPRSVELALREDPPDVVVAHDFGAPVFTALRARQAGLAFEDTLFVIVCHGPRRYALDLAGELAPTDLRHVLATGVLEEAALELADVAVSPSDYLFGWFRERDWRLPVQSLVIPHFGRTDVLDEPRTLPAHGVATEVERLVFFGRLDERKGITLFAGALNALEPELLRRVEVEFLGRTTPMWRRERIERLLKPATRHELRGIDFRTDLDQPQALERLRRPGTVAVMPSLSETFSNTVSECLEHGIPFLASNVGGVPELVAPDDRERVLFEPSSLGLAQALRRALSERGVPRPAEPAFDSRTSFARWEEVVTLRPQTRSSAQARRVDAVVTRREPGDEVGPCVRALERQKSADVNVIVADARETPLDAARASAVVEGSAPYVVFLEEGDIVADDFVATLLEAQAAAAADVVTCSTRAPDGTLHLLPGDPGGLGVLANGYGSVALVRRDALDPVTPPFPPEHDAAWPLLAHFAASGARITSVPSPLVVRAAAVGTVEATPRDALLAVQELERALPDALRGTARLAAGLAADAAPENGRREAARHPPVLLPTLVALTLAALALRVLTLGRQSYWYDELVTVSLLHRPFVEMLRAIPRSEATPYVYYVLAWPWTRLFGFGEAGLRALSALAGALTVPAAYAAGASLVSRRVAVVAAALVATNPFLIWYSQEARAYALFALLAAISLFFFARALDAGRRSLIGWSLTAALALATHYFAIFVVAAEAAWLVLRRVPRALPAVLLPTAVVAAEVPLVLKQRNNGGNLSASPLLHRIAGIPKDLAVGYSFPLELLGTLAAALLLTAGLVLAIETALRPPLRRAWLACAIAVSAIAIPIALALAGADYVIARNVIAAVVPAAIFLATGYAAHRLGLVAAALLCGLSAAIAVAVEVNPRYGRTDWRGAARELRATARPRAIVATPTIDAQLLRPYLPGLAPPGDRAVAVAEIDVVALASQGGFSSGSVHPPRTPPRAAPPGFRLVADKRSPTFVLVRYDAPSARRLSPEALAALSLGPVPPTLLLQGRTRRGGR